MKDNKEINIDREQIKNLLQNRLTKMDLRIIKTNWERNWKTHWVGIVVNQEPISRRETDSVLKKLEKQLWQWDKVRYQFYIIYNKFCHKDRCVAYRNGQFLSQKEWHKEFKLNFAGSNNKGVWRQEYFGDNV